MRNPFRKPIGRHRNKLEHEFEDTIRGEFLNLHPGTELKCTECGKIEWQGQPIPLLVWPAGRLVCPNCEAALTHAWLTKLIDHVDLSEDEEVWLQQ